MNEELPIWSFNIGAAAINYHVTAKDAAEAYLVACAWCKEKGKRLPAVVTPFIVAGPEILNPVPPVPTEEPVTQSLMDKAKALVWAPFPILCARRIRCWQVQKTWLIP